MSKGFFTQSAALLLERVPTKDELAAALEGCEIRGQLQFSEKREDGTVPEGRGWAGDDATVVGMGEGSKGAVLVDVVPVRWPDQVGQGGAEDIPDAQPSEEDQRLVAAYVMGHFGPFAFPFALDRAVGIGQASGFDAAGAVEKHTAFLRLRTSWVLGEQDPSAPPVPEDYDALKELRFLTELSANLLEEIPGALCYFNPNGEILAEASHLEASLEHSDKHEMPALDLWSNLRLFALQDLDGFAMMDTIGMPQLDVFDHEAFFPKDKYDPRELGAFLREASYFTLIKGASSVTDGIITRGPGKRDWRALIDRDALVPAPRPVIRWIPMDGTHIPDSVMERPKRDEETPQEA